MRRAVLTIALVLCVACTHKKKERGAPESLTGLGAIPASARVVLAAAPGRLADSDVVARAFARLLARDPDLAQRVARLAEGCKLDWRTQLQSLHIALTDAAPQPMLVATGQLVEADLAKCVQTTVGAGGGSLTVEQVEGRSLYHVTEGTREMWFAFGASDTVVLSAARDLVVAGLGTGQKVLDVPEMRALIEGVDTRSPLWAVGRVDAQLGQRLLRLTRGRVQTPPKAFTASMDPTDGLHADIAAVTASADDAKVLESNISFLLAAVAMAAQSMDLGPLASKVTAHADGAEVHITVALTDDELKELLSKVDSAASAPQDAGPSTAVDGSPTHGP